VNVAQATDLTRDTSSFASHHAENHLILIHVFMSSSRSSFSEVHSFVITILIADENEASTADAGVVATDDTDAENGADQRIYSIALFLRLVQCFEEVDLSSTYALS
jgi:hypothetical protein